MKKILILVITLVSLQSYSQVKISQILGYEYNNQKNTFTTNVVGNKNPSNDVSGNQTMVVIKLNRIPGQEYKYIKRTLKITAQYENNGKVEEVFEKIELIVPMVEETFFVPLIIQRGATETTIKAELYEEGKLVSTKKQLLLASGGD
ncbi:MAG: hypothetical protein IPP81_19985 [Chitinophagaceae bacterium]|nr:hypothetical protein [Chitinophagaceae bacterium]